MPQHLDHIAVWQLRLVTGQELALELVVLAHELEDDETSLVQGVLGHLHLARRRLVDEVPEAVPPQKKALCLDESLEGRQGRVDGQASIG